MPDSDSILAKHRDLRDVVLRFEQAGGDALQSIVLYGPAAHDDDYADGTALHLLVVLRDLELQTLDLVGAPLRHWVKRGNPMPRFFSPALIRDAADVFPMEFLELSAYRVILSGDDPFTGFEVTRAHLRGQCERELREKMMRLREAYLEAQGKPKLVRKLLRESYLAFAEVFRGCLFLVEDAPPEHNRDVVGDFCGRVGVEPAPFHEVEAMLRGEGSADVLTLFPQYYAALTAAVNAVDRLDGQEIAP